MRDPWVRLSASVLAAAMAACCREGKDEEVLRDLTPDILEAARLTRLANGDTDGSA